jgi:large subunit ribosomal protein L15
MAIHAGTLRPPRGANKPPKRIGFGMGSGHGKTATRGSKGQRSRTGSRTRPGFEGGQMPLHRRLPKRGFTPPSQAVYNEVNLRRIQRAIDAGKLGVDEPITLEALLKAGVVTHPHDGVKILGSGELKARATFEVAAASRAATAAIEQAGGTLKTVREEPSGAAS